MNNVNSVRIRYEDLRSLGFASITSNYVAVGTAFANPVSILRVTNTTDANLLVSFDGVADQDICAGNSAYVYDYCTNRASQAGYAEQSAGERIYIKAEGTLLTMGTVYVTLIYRAQA